MIKLKFRAWLKNSEKMVEVNTVHLLAEYIEYIEKNEEGVSTLKTELFENIELMQYTSLKDKNGKEIYEGDIIESNVLINFKSDVFFSKKSASFVIKNNLGTEFYLEKEMIKREFEVIGNIYENKDLIKKIRTRKENVLKVEVTKINDEYSSWYITYQNEEVLKRNDFRDEKLKVSSCFCPYFDEKKLYLRGDDKAEDCTPMIINNEKVPLLQEKVKQVNEKYGIIKHFE
ncbi:YopX family protein [Streptobacillus moniliformis]|uniref:YopX family protein n=1 Tax=Streptobacillus moniliformis TaxID=34105 RepID=UPI0007E3ECC9|nr:YopX family protein [Streptobacillus moniliformis]